MFFSHRKSNDSKHDYPKHTAHDNLDTLFSEYKIVTDKVTALSLRFSNGSYLIPGGAAISLISAYHADDNTAMSFVILIIPILLSLLLYNHLRYMSLQFKLSGYARHLENTINAIAGEKILLWENLIARAGSQNFFEGIFIGLVYIGCFALSFITGYQQLFKLLLSNVISYRIGVLISFIYCMAVVLLVMFLSLFTNVHYTVQELIAKSIPVKYELNKSRKSIRSLFQRKSVRLLIIVFIIACIPLSAYPLVRWYGSAQRDFTSLDNSYDSVIVLGNKSADYSPSEDMVLRMKCLREYDLNAENEYIIILSGGNGEAELMKSLLHEYGIERQVKCESASTNTEENIINSSKMATENSLVVTSEYHAFRTELIINKNHLDYKIRMASSGHHVIIKNIRECYAIFFADLW